MQHALTSEAQLQPHCATSPQAGVPADIGAKGLLRTKSRQAQCGWRNWDDASLVAGTHCVGPLRQAGCSRTRPRC